MSDLMFKTAVKHVAKSTGSKTLHPVTDLNSAERFHTMCLVKRKTSFWFWKKSKMTPTQITLDNLFEEDLKLSKPKTAMLLEKFTETPTLKVNGSVGGCIASKLNISLKASDEMILTVKLGDIQKSEMDWEQLQEALQKQTINVRHEIFEEVENSNRTTLCVVLESISTMADGSLEDESTKSVSTDDKGDIHKSSISVDVSTKGSVEMKKVNSYLIPPSTVLAYSCNEFSINADCFATLHVAVDRQDSTHEGLFIEDPACDPFRVIQVELKELIKSDKFNRLRNELKLMLESATDTVLATMHLLLSAAEFKIENKNEEKIILASTVSELLLNGENQPFKSILEHLGFLLPEEWNDPKALVQFPEVDDSLIKPIISLLDALEDVEMDVRTLLPDISHDNMKIIYKIVENEVNGIENLIKDSDIQGMFKKATSTRLLLKNAGFVEMKIDDEDVLVFTKRKDFDLMDLYAIFYTLSY